MSDYPKKPYLDPEPTRTKSGQLPAVKAFRKKLESIQDGEHERFVDLNEQIGNYVDQLRAMSTPPPKAPTNPPPAEEPISVNDIVGWDDETDTPLRRRDLLELSPHPKIVSQQGDEPNMWNVGDLRERPTERELPPDSRPTPTPKKA